MRKFVHGQKSTSILHGFRIVGGESDYIFLHFCLKFADVVVPVWLVFHAPLDSSMRKKPWFR